MSNHKVVPGTYSIQSVKYPSQDIDIGLNKVNAIGWRAASTPKQRWVLHSAENDTFIITNVLTGQHLTAEGDNVIVGHKVSKWNIVPEGKGPDGKERYKIQLNGDGRAAKLTGPQNDAPIKLVNFIKAEDELWHFNHRLNLD